MTRQIRFQLKLNGQALKIQSVDRAKGLLFTMDGSDLFPRRCEFTYTPATDFQDRFRDYLVENNVREIDIKPVENDQSGDLVFTCNPQFPAMPFMVRLRIVGLEVPGPQPFVVPQGSKEADPLSIDIKRKSIKLTANPIAFEPHIRRLIASPDSVIDGLQASNWLSLQAVDAQRRACVLNLLAKLRCVPSLEDPLIEHVDHIIGVQLERMYVRVEPSLASADSLLSRGDSFNDKGVPQSATHQLLLEWIRTKLRPVPETTAYGLKSFRQAVTTDSMQIVVATPEDTNSSAGRYADLDIDLGDPNTDLVGFGIHMGELAGDSITDHIALHNDLVRDNTLKQFLYYDVVSS